MARYCSSAGSIRIRAGWPTSTGRQPPPPALAPSLIRARSYDRATNAWARVEPAGAAPSPRDKLAAAALGGRVVLFGGFGPAPADPGAEPGADAASTSFVRFGDTLSMPASGDGGFRAAAAPAPPARCAHGMCAAGQGLVLFGGRGEAGRLCDTHTLGPEEGAGWRAVEAAAEAPPAVSFHALCAVGPRREAAVLLGGRRADDSHMAEVWAIQFPGGEWSRVAPSGTGCIPPAHAVRGCADPGRRPSPREGIAACTLADGAWPAG